MSKKNNDFNYKDGVTLKEFLLAKLEAQEMALKLARESMEHRLEGMNEFRDTLKDQASRFITRTELESVTGKYDVEIKELNKAKDVLEGKASQKSVNIVQIISVVGLISAIVSLIHGFMK